MLLSTRPRRAAQPKPFVIFRDAKGRVSVRIGTQRPSFAAAEIVVNAGMVIVTTTEDGLQISGEGVVRRHANTIAITS